jgi:glycosyltransferase involved in cell wall biosynthesis
MPVFNGEHFLVEAVESILAQDEPDLELIIADNASTDATPDICRDFAVRDSRVRYVGSERNRGIAWNFNRLVDLARAPYFKWADSDDVIEASLVRHCAAALDADPSAVLAYTWARYIDQAGNTLRDTVKAPQYGSEHSTVGRVKGFLRLSTTHVLELQGVIRRQELSATCRMGPYATSDLVLILELAMHGRFAEIPEPLFHHRMHDARASLAAPSPRERSRIHTEDGRAVLLPRWRLATGLARGVLTSPATISQRLQILPWVGLWAAHHWTQLAFDLVEGLPGPGARAADAVRRRRAYHRQLTGAPTA